MSTFRKSLQGAGFRNLALALGLKPPWKQILSAIRQVMTVTLINFCYHKTFLVYIMRVFKNSSIILFFSVSSIVIISFFMRLWLPFGSEPDFHYRVNEILSDDTALHLKFLKYFYIDHGWSPSCRLDYNVKSIIGRVDNFFCGEDIYLKLSRWVLHIFYILCIFLFWLAYEALVFNRVFMTYNQDLKIKFVSIFLSMLYPSMIYYGSVVAVEQITFFLSCMLIFFYTKPFFLLLLVIMIFKIEVGSGIVFFLFFSFLFLFLKLRCLVSVRMSELIAFVLICVAYIFNMQLLKILYILPVVGSKAELIYDAYTYSSYAEVVDKYPLYLRPIITFFSAVFMTSDGLKAILLYPIVLYFLCVMLKRLRVRALEEHSSYHYSIFIAVITFVLCTVFVLPGYSNAKYYVFTIPFLFYIASSVFKLRDVYLFSLLSSLYVVFQLFVVRTI